MTLDFVQGRILLLGLGQLQVASFQGQSLHCLQCGPIHIGNGVLPLLLKCTSGYFQEWPTHDRYLKDVDHQPVPNMINSELQFYVWYKNIRLALTQNAQFGLRAKPDVILLSNNVCQIFSGEGDFF